MQRQAQLLIIDDDPIIIDQLQTELTHQSYLLDSARDGEIALEKIKKNPPDLILIDLLMPKISGFEICRRIRSNTDTRFIPIIVITDIQEQDDKIKAIELGVDDFLVKPINRLELTSRIASLLRMKLMHDDLDTSESILFSLVGALEAKDCYTRGHSERVSDLAVKIGRRMHLSKVQLDFLRKGGLLHDIGKIGVKESILFKPGRLSTEELAHIKIHSKLGYDICEPLKSLENCLSIIRSHHERIDGHGYPDGLKGNDIPTHARITAVADAFDAMTTNRPYREGLPVKTALNIFSDEQHSGQWDPICVDHLLEIISESNS